MSELLQSGHHPDADQLCAFVERALLPHEREQTLAHLAGCERCRTIVALLLPAVEEPVSSRARRTGKRWFSGWNLAWAAAPVLAALSFLVVSLHRGVPARSVPVQVAAVGTPAPEASVPERARDLKPRRTVHAPVVVSPKAAPAVGLEAQGITAAPVGGRPMAPTGSVAGATPAGPVEGRRVDALAAEPVAGRGLSGSSAGAPLSYGASQGAAAGIGGSTLGVARFSALSKVRIAQPLPSGLPILSTVRAGRRQLALDTGHTLFVSDDDGQHWQAAAAPWTGHAVRISLASAAPVPAPASKSGGFATGAGMGVPAAPSGAMQPVKSTATPAASSVLTGTVKDASGAVIAGANVIVSDPGSAVTRTATTDASGVYQVGGLAPGSYRVEAQAPGFVRQTRFATLAPAQQGKADLTLPVGQSMQTVSVQAEASPVILQTAPAAHASPARSSAVPPRFVVTTESGDRWISADGQSWEHQ